MLHHPIYAGAYSYGRHRVDHKRTAASGGKIKTRAVPMSEWLVLQRDRLPAYITWAQYERNLARFAGRTFHGTAADAIHRAIESLRDFAAGGEQGRPPETKKEHLRFWM